MRGLDGLVRRDLADDVEVLAAEHLGAHRRPHRRTRARGVGGQSRFAHHVVGPDQREVAEQDRGGLTELRRRRRCQLGVAVPASANSTCTVGKPAAGGRGVDDVVVDERARPGPVPAPRTRAARPSASGPSGSPPAPSQPDPGERRADPLAAAQHELTRVSVDGVGVTTADRVDQLGAGGEEICAGRPRRRPGSCGGGHGIGSVGQDKPPWSDVLGTRSGPTVRSRHRGSTLPSLAQGSRDSAPDADARAHYAGARGLTIRSGRPRTARVGHPHPIHRGPSRCRTVAAGFRSRSSSPRLATPTPRRACGVRCARSSGCGPAFVSMTYGAGGSTRDRTVRVTGDLAERDHAAPGRPPHRGGPQRRRTARHGRCLRRPGHQQHPRAARRPARRSAGRMDQASRRSSSTPTSWCGSSAISATSTSVSRRSPKGTTARRTSSTTPATSSRSCVRVPSTRSPRCSSMSSTTCGCATGSRRATPSRAPSRSSRRSCRSPRCARCAGCLELSGFEAARRRSTSGWPARPATGPKRIAPRCARSASRSQPRWANG